MTFHAVSSGWHSYVLGPPGRADASAHHQSQDAMELTKKFVKAKNPCASGYRWFIRDHHGHGDYQSILDALVADGRIDDACWLLDQFGPIEAVLRVDAIDAHAIVFAGTLEVRNGINVDTLVRAGRHLCTGGGIRAGTAIVAGSDIEAAGNLTSGGHIQAGGDISAGWGIEAATRLDAGGHCRAKWDIQAGSDIVVAQMLQADGSIRAEQALRCGRGIRAGADVAAGHDLLAAQGILAGGGITAGNHIDSAWGIKAADDILAQGTIRAGEGVEAGGDIGCGAGYGIYAGLQVRRDAWADSARIQARQRPEGLISGHWVGDDA